MFNRKTVTLGMCKALNYQEDAAEDESSERDEVSLFEEVESLLDSPEQTQQIREIVDQTVKRYWDKYWNRQPVLLQTNWARKRKNWIKENYKEVKAKCIKAVRGELGALPVGDQACYKPKK